ncbi:hypothetical protein BD413DRAFT_4632 [Trametes elegans]|nr:hypothetical protein BD413DRAFT_4632 [Trametes elegans]
MHLGRSCGDASRGKNLRCAFLPLLTQGRVVCPQGPRGSAENGGVLAKGHADGLRPLDVQAYAPRRRVCGSWGERSRTRALFCGWEQLCQRAEKSRDNYPRLRVASGKAVNISLRKGCTVTNRAGSRNARRNARRALISAVVEYVGSGSTLSCTEHPLVLAYLPNRGNH